MEKHSFVIEECPSGIAVDYWDNHYMLLQYSNGTIRRKMELGASTGGTSGVGYSLYVWDEFRRCTETVLYTEDEYAVGELGSVGKYNDSKNFVASGLMEFGFPMPQQYYDDFFPTYLNHKSSTKLCLIRSGLKNDNWLNMIIQCDVTDYTGVHKK